MKQALIDIGSNSIRLSVYEIIDRSSFRILFKEKIMAGLAGYVDEGFLIHDDRVLHVRYPHSKNFRRH